MVSHCFLPLPKALFLGLKWRLSLARREFRFHPFWFRAHGPSFGIYVLPGQFQPFKILFLFARSSSAPLFYGAGLSFFRSSCSLNRMWFRSVLEGQVQFFSNLYSWWHLSVILVFPHPGSHQAMLSPCSFSFGERSDWLFFFTWSEIRFFVSWSTSGPGSVEVSEVDSV